MWLIRHYAAPIRRAAELLEAMAVGDTTCQLPVNRRNELGRLTLTVNTTIDGMQSALSEAARISAMVEPAPVAWLCAEGDLIVRYSDPAARTVVKTFAAHLALSPLGWWERRWM